MTKQIAPSELLKIVKYGCKSDCLVCLTEQKFNSKLVYFKNMQEITQETDVKLEETMIGFVTTVRQPGIIDKVRINMIQHSCTYNNDFTDILLDTISKGFNMNLWIWTTLSQHLK